MRVYAGRHPRRRCRCAVGANPRRVVRQMNQAETSSRSSERASEEQAPQQRERDQCSAAPREPEIYARYREGSGRRRRGARGGRVVQ